ncbi:MAG: hypothetical protein Q9160_000019 [Pyrenula sp. 1 TL-2023]
MPPKEKYTDPKLRDEVKEDIQNSDKGGAPGQWSARKAQFMASEYKKRGGDYNTEKKDQDESQKNLSKWSEEEWQTKEGSGNAKQDDGTQKRYLPKKAWEQMSDEEKEQTEEKKIEGSKEGKQFVGNTGKAKGAREKANDEEDKAYEGKKRREKGEEENAEEEDEGVDIVDDEDGEEDEEYEEDADGADEGGEEDEEDAEGDDGDDADDAEAGEKDEKQPKTRGQKRGKSTNGTSSSNKKQKSNTGSAKSKSNGNSNGNDSKKTVGSKHQPADAPAPQASADRLPKKGQAVTWKALPGWVEGECIDVVYKDTTIEGKSTKASEGDPRIFMRSKNGKVAVHKPQAVYFD